MIVSLALAEEGVTPVLALKYLHFSALSIMARISLFIGGKETLGILPLVWPSISGLLKVLAF